MGNGKKLGIIMKVINSPLEAQEILHGFTRQSKSIGFVPTMGALHKGHLSLVDYSLKENDVTVVSIFVNPLQFGPNEDLSSYPRDIEKDIALLQNKNVDVLYFPQVSDMYGEGPNTIVSAPESLQRKLCGLSRPGHFDGVTAVVAKLFNIVRPNSAYFGMKDYQQLLIIKKMVQDLNFPVSIVACPILREEDGLAMSSRNVYLTTLQRSQVPAIYSALNKIAVGFDFKIKNIKEDFIDEVESSIDGAKVDYIELYDSDSLSKVSTETKSVLAAAAVFIGKVRLIDNIVFPLKEAV